MEANVDIEIQFEQTLCALALCAARIARPPGLHADEVLLANGDRITGTVMKKEGDILVFTTDYAGELDRPVGSGPMPTN